jgi:hypothetical protein
MNTNMNGQLIQRVSEAIAGSAMFAVNSIAKRILHLMMRETVPSAAIISIIGNVRRLTAHIIQWSAMAVEKSGQSPIALTATTAAPSAVIRNRNMNMSGCMVEKPGITTIF